MNSRVLVKMPNGDFAEDSRNKLVNVYLAIQHISFTIKEYSIDYNLPSFLLVKTASPI